MEPTLFHHILHSVITRRLRQVTSLMRFTESTSSDRGLRITKDVPVVRGDHGALKTTLLGVWRVAASTLTRGSACAETRASCQHQPAGRSQPHSGHDEQRSMRRKRPRIFGLGEKK